MLERIRNRTLRWTLRIALAVVLFVIGWYAASRITSPMNAARVVETGPAAETPKFNGRLRIAAYNIAHGRGTAESNWQWRAQAAHLERLSGIARLLKEQQLDVVVLNEVDLDAVWTGHVNQAEVIAREAGFAYRAEGRNIDAAAPCVALRFGNAVLSRYPISDARSVDFPDFSRSETVFAGKKRGLLCTLRLSDERRIRVLAVHLEHRAERVRVASARIINALYSEDAPPLVAAGDFNSTRLDFPRATLDAEGHTALSDLLESHHWKTLPDTDLAPADLTFSSVNPRSVIDWILVPADWTIVSKTVIDTQLSDHFPVVMEVRLPDD